jgi:hypothetical protein
VLRENARREHTVKNYDSDWTDDQRALYDECYAIGHAWAEDADTPPDQLQQVLDLAEADDEDLGGLDIDYPPLVDAVAEATGEDVTTVPATHEDPGFRGFAEGARDGAP